MKTLPPIQIEKDSQAVAQRASDLIVEAANIAIKEKGFFTLVLSGGHTPILTYQNLALRSLPWNNIYIFWGDERNVSPDSPLSNYREAYRNFISKISIPVENIYRIQGELANPHIAANIYNEDIRTFFKNHGLKSPVFDFIVLGMGEDGHTASLFPGVSYIQEIEKWVSSFWIPKLNTFRISLLPRIINQSANILVLIVGENKAVVLKNVIEDYGQKNDFPILDISPVNGKIIWLVDKSAASHI